MVKGQVDMAAQKLHLEYWSDTSMRAYMEPRSPQDDVANRCVRSFAGWS